MEATMTTADRSTGAGEPRPCEGCPVATSRRAFLREAALSAAAAIAALSVVNPASLFAEAVSEITPTSTPTAGLLERTYAIPATDSVSVDVGNDVILARWQNRVYAFSLKCPHKGARLEWRNSEKRVFCPKHKARFLADGSHVSGRGKRDLDRYEIHRTPDGIVVDLRRARRADTDPDAWARTVVSL
jgi:nitrite reductase/ring-hydroxylating ferredoxin subunit